MSDTETRYVVRAIPGVDPYDFGEGAFDGSHATEAEAQDALEDLAATLAADSLANGGLFSTFYAANLRQLQVEELA